MAEEEAEKALSKKEKTREAAGVAQSQLPPGVSRERAPGNSEFGGSINKEKDTHKRRSYTNRSSRQTDSQAVVVIVSEDRRAGGKAGGGGGGGTLSGIEIVREKL